MQGRLVPPCDGRFQSFPRDRWADEFPLAEQAELSSIEWIYDFFGADVNPIGTDEGIARMKALSARHNVQIHSVCADYFMDKPFLRAKAADVDERIENLRWLLIRCQLLPVNRVILPFVDVSRIESAEEAEQVLAILKEVVETAVSTNIELHLETSLPPRDFTALLDKFPHPLVMVNYDSGNSASFGYNVRDEFLAYGARIGSVHIKDRVRGGGTVPLGSGDADLPILFDELKKAGYQRDFILQVARDADGGELAWTQQNRAYIEDLWLGQSEPPLKQ